MNLKTYLYSIALFSFSSFNSFAQTQEFAIKEKQHMMLKIVELFEDYERFSAIDEDFPEYVPSFCSLFINDEVSVYNDLIGIAYETSLPVKKYTKLMSESSTTTRISISNLACQSPYYDNGVWKIMCTFEKKINLTNKCGIEFASDFFNSSDYHLSATIVYNSNTKRCLFEKIDGSTQIKRQLVEGYRVVMKKSPRDEKVLYNNEPLVFNEMGQAFIPPTGTYVYQQDLDVVVKEIVDEEQCRMVHLKYGIKPWRIKAHYDLGLGNALSVANKSFYSNVGSKSTSYGIDVGYVFHSKRKLKIGVFMGFGISNNSLDLSKQMPTYDFVTNQDLDGDSYQRIYENVSLSQKNKITEFSIPVYADIDWRFSRWLSMYVNLGFKLNINMSSSINEFAGSADNIHGIYPQYDNLMFDYHWGYNGFVQHQDFTKDNLLDAEGVAIKKFAPDLLAGFGFRLNIPRTPLALELGLGYQKGLGNLISVSEKENPEAYSSKLVYNEMAGQNSIEHVRDMMESAGAVSRGMLKFNIGLIYKF